MKVIFGVALQSALLFLAITQSAYAEKEGGGGAAAVCRDERGRILSAQLLDIYEGVVRFRMNIPKSNESSDLQLNKAVSKLSIQSYYQAIIRDTASDVIKQFIFLPPGVGLAPGVVLG